MMGYLGIFLSTICGLMCYLSRCDWWLVGVVIGFIIQAFALALANDKAKE